MSKKFNALKDKFESRKNIVRVQKNKDNPYVMINKQGLNDTRLSWSAKGLLSYLLSLPDDWEIFANELVNHTSSGRDHTYTVINELLKHGYMEKTQYRCEGKVLGLNYTVFEVSAGQDNSKAIIVNVTLSDNGEIVEMSTIRPNTETPETVEADTDSTELLINNITNNDFNKKELVVVVDEKETQLLELYKTFKIEKRIMPHTQKLLKENLHISLEVFEEIFISASEDSVSKKYAYIKTIIDNLNKANIKTLEEFNSFNSKFKESKNTTNSKGSYATKKNRFHNFNQTFTKYKAEELEKVCKESQDMKPDFNQNKDNFDFGQDAYNKAVELSWYNLSLTTKMNAIAYAKANNLPYKEM